MTTIINAATSGGLIQTADTSGVLQLQTASTAAVTIDASQRVGVTATSPRRNLEVAGTIAAPTALATAITTSANGTIVVADTGGTVGSVIGTSLNGSSYDTYIQARNMGAASTPYNLVLNPLGGNVGVGVTPNTWGNGNAVQLLGGSVWSYSNAYVDVLANAYWDGSVYKYVSNNPVSQFRQFGGQFIWNSAPTGTAGNTVSLVETMRLNTTGNLSLKGGTTTADGTGITFPATQSASSDANTLDDYEEGTWTPTITNATTYGPNTSGRYVKIGRQVFINGNIECTAFNNTGSTPQVLGNFPFAAENYAEVYGQGVSFQVFGFNQANMNLVIQVSKGSAQATLYTVSPSTGQNYTSVLPTTFNSNTVIYEFSVVYIASS